MLEIVDCEQGTPEWHAVRCGIPTASRFKDVLAKGEGKTRDKYLRDLAAEAVRGWIEEDSYTNAHMERGHAMEDEARRLYAFMTDAEPVKVGFIRNGNVGCSPDSLIGDDGGLEIKSALGHIQIDRLQRNVLPPEHRAQVQGSMWVTERKWWDFVSYAAGLPPLILRVERDEAYITSLAAAVSSFNEELAELVTTIRSYGNPEVTRNQFRAAVEAA